MMIFDVYTNPNPTETHKSSLSKKSKIQQSPNTSKTGVTYGNEIAARAATPWWLGNGVRGLACERSRVRIPAPNESK